MTRFEALLRSLSQKDVRFVLVGGVAALAHGSARMTEDIDVVYDRTDDNLERLVEALAPHSPYLRGAPPGLPFRWDVDTLKRGLNFTLATDLGSIDLFGEIIGGGTYESLSPSAEEIEIFGIACQCIDLRSLIQAKRAAGRPKDLEVIAELESLLEERRD